MGRKNRAAGASDKATRSDMAKKLESHKKSSVFRWIATVLPAVVLTIAIAAVFTSPTRSLAASYENLWTWLGIDGKTSAKGIGIPAQTETFSSYKCNSHHAFSPSIKNRDPLIMILDDFISDFEIRHMLELG